MKDDKYKSEVKVKVRKAAFENLKQVKSGHSKMDNVEYDKLELAKYLQSPLFDRQSVEMLLALRTRTVRTIKNDS